MKRVRVMWNSILGQVYMWKLYVYVAWKIRFDVWMDSVEKWRKS